MTRHHHDTASFHHERFAALRSLLQSQPGPEAWDAVCELAQAWRGEAFEQVERYIEDHIAHWPDEARTLPKRWRSWIWHGEDVPQLRLARHLRLGVSYEPTLAARHMERLEVLFDHAHLSRITHLTIESLPRPLPTAMLDGFLARQPQPLAFVSLVYYAGHSPPQAELEQAATFVQNMQTRELHLFAGPPALNKAALRGGTPLAAHLEELLLPSWHLDRELVAQLDPAQLPHLRRIRLHTPHIYWHGASQREAGLLLLEDPRFDPAQRSVVARHLSADLGEPIADDDGDIPF